MLLDGTRPWLDPGFTSLNRLPVRPAMEPCPDAATARRAGTASPWWLSLDGEWDFILLDSPEDVTSSELLGPGDGTSIAVPGAWTLQGFDHPHYTNVVMPFGGEPPTVPAHNPTGVYRRTVTVPGEWEGRRCVLRVGGAESMVLVHVDGLLVGAATDSRLASEFDLTDRVSPGASHVLSLVVPRWSAATWLEDQDQWWHGGLQRPVELYSTAPSHLMTAKLVPGLAGGTGGRVLGAAEVLDGLLEAELVFAGPLRGEPGWTAEVRVETLRGRRLASTGRLPVDRWDDSNMLALMVGAMATEPGVVRARLEVPGVNPWSAESPRLYRAMVVLRGPGGDVVEVDAVRIGFRDVQVRGRELLVNGAPVVLRGVNLHEHDPRWGRWADRTLAETDLRMIKAANLNAVRAAHYPHAEHFTDLCDEIGLYLVDEANIETHGRQHSLCHDPRFGPAMSERIERMARRDVHHPSVIVWSLGNESGYSAVHDAAAAWLRAWDPSRPVQYEGPFMHDLHAEAPVSDVVCPMYTSVEVIRAWAKDAADDRRPLILCEYSHAMGNAGGSLVDYDDAFEEVEGLQGGFIWEWTEHGIPLPGTAGPTGGPSWGYGGDFGDEPNDGNFVCDGLVSAAREPHPLLEEVRWLGRPVRCVGTDTQARSASVVVRNQRWFTDTSDLEMRWELTADGEVTAAGVCPRATLAPRRERRIVLRWPATALRQGAEHLLSLRWHSRGRRPWGPKGGVVGWEQVALPEADDAAHERRRRPKAPEPRSRSRSRSRVTPPRGFPEELTPTLFRALTDNDGIRVGWMRGLNGSLARWVDELGLDRCEWDPEAGTLQPAADVPPLRVLSEVTDLEDGWRSVGVRFELPEQLADPPRLGIAWELPGELERLEWYGEGPTDSYPDRCGAALLGRWRSTVSQQYVDYGMPQEHAHHGGLRWVALRGPEGGVLVVADGTPGFSARHHSDAELWRARHTHDLSPLGSPRATYLAVDVAQRGLGQSSLGAEAGDRYRIPAGPHRLDLLVRGLARREDPGAWYARRPRRAES